jgi:ribose 5-phosphate isomerase A
MARELVASRLRGLGGQPKPRDGVVTDNGQLILDVAGLQIADPAAMEAEINQWPGVVTVGLFALEPADVALVATPHGVEQRLARPG